MSRVILNNSMLICFYQEPEVFVFMDSICLTIAVTKVKIYYAANVFLPQL